jgi:hypothetical protein
MSVVDEWISELDCGAVGTADGEHLHVSAYKFEDAGERGVEIHLDDIAIVLTVDQVNELIDVLSLAREAVDKRQPKSMIRTAPVRISRAT